MSSQCDTYDRRIQLGASRQRRKDAEVLYQTGRWAGTMYLAGYAIECSLKSLICYMERKNNFKETNCFQRGVQGATMHNLVHLLKELPRLRRLIALDMTGKYEKAWNIVAQKWRKDELRYWDKQGNEEESQQFVNAVKELHSLILRQQGEAS